MLQPGAAEPVWSPLPAAGVPYHALHELRYRGTGRRQSFALTAEKRKEGPGYE